MPDVISGTVAFVGWLKAVATAYPIATAIAKVAVVAGSYTYSRAQTKKALRRALGSMDSSRGVSIREPAATRRIIYGRMRVGGTIVFAQTSGTGNEFLHMIVAHCEGPVEAIDSCYLNDDIVPLDGSGNATGKYAGYVTIKKHLGATDQTVDTALQTAVGSSVWSNNHRLRGICYSYVRLKHNPDLFPAGLPNYSATIHGRNDITDPRDASTGYTTNAALCLRHYMLLPKADGGLGASASEIDDDAVETAANICDEDVDLNPSGTENRYALNGVVDTANEPGRIIEGMCSAMAGICPYVGGKFKMKAGAHTASVFTFTEDDIIGRVQFQTRDSMREAFNGVKGVYVTEVNKFQPADFPPVVNATYTSEDGGSRIWKDVDFEFTTSTATVQRLAKIDLERSRQDIVVTFETKLGAIDVHVGDVVALTLARYGWSSKLFEVTHCGFVVNDGGDGPTLALKWTVRETASAVWDWNSGEETEVDTAPNTDLPDLFTVAQLTGLTLSNTGFLQADGTWQPRVLAKWTAASDTYVSSGGAVNIEYKKSTSTTWLVRDGRIRGDETEAAITDVEVASTVQVRGRFENVRFVRGAYSSTASVAVAGDTTAANNPTGFTLIAGDSSSQDAPPPKLYNGALMLGLSCKFTPSTSKDVRFVEFVMSTSSGGAEVIYGTNGPEWRVSGGDNIVHCYKIDGADYSSTNLYCKTVDQSGNFSSFTSCGAVNSYLTLPAGTMTEQDADAVNITGGVADDVDLATGSLALGNPSASSVREVIAEYDESIVRTLAGGAASESMTVPLTNRGFGAKPDTGLIQIASNDTSLDAFYDYDHGSNSSTVAWLIVHSRDGGNISAGARRFSVNLKEYD